MKAWKEEIFSSVIEDDDDYGEALYGSADEFDDELEESDEMEDLPKCLTDMFD